MPAEQPFYTFIETAFNHGIISGYADGTFRPGANVTRGQFRKIIVGAQGWAIDTSGGPHFSDVPPSNPFYAFVETAFNHGIISGYADGTFRPAPTPRAARSPRSSMRRCASRRPAAPRSESPDSRGRGFRLPAPPC